MANRTTLRFNSTADIWPTVEKWAGENGYKLKESNGPERSFQKGSGFLVAPMKLTIRFENQEVNLEAWISANLFVRICSFFILPAEMGIESGGFRAVLPRNMARTAVNKLLAQFGQPAIP